jgi:hypothetical protein
VEEKMKGINSQERAYLKYKPSLKYDSKILSIVTEDAGYTPSSIVDNLLNKKPSGVLGEINELLDMNKMMQERLAKCLEDTNVNGITVSDYLKNARDKDGDKELVRQFNKDNARAINGTTQAECLPLLLEMEEELNYVSNNINKHFYNNEADTDHLETVEYKDDIRLDALVEKDKEGSLSNLDLDSIGFESVLLEIASRRVDNCRNFLKEINETLYSTVNTYYNDNIDSIVKTYGSTDITTLSVINDMNKVTFRSVSKLSEEDNLRNARLNSVDMKANLQEMLNRIGELKQQSHSILNFALSLDTDYDQNENTQIVSDAFDQVEFINEEYEKAILEVFKQIKLDELAKTDIIDTMKQKREARQKISLITDIIKEKESGTFNAELFVKSKGLRNAGTICSK